MWLFTYMKLFKYENHNVVVDAEVFTLLEFKKILDRDKTKDKSNTFKELAFIYHYADLKSDFGIIINEDDKTEAIKKRVGLSEKWTIDPVIKAAIELYEERTVTAQMKIYLDARKGAIDMGEYLADAGTLLRERNDNGGLVTPPATIASALKSIPQVIKDLDKIESEVIKQQEGMTEKSIGSRTLNIYEDDFIED